MPAFAMQAELVQGRSAGATRRVINEDGELLAESTINPIKDHQPQKDPNSVPMLSGMSRDTRPGCLATQHQRARRDSNPQPSDP